MHNQDFGPLKLFLIPFLPLVWWMDRQSDFEVLDEIAYYQDLESQRIHPYQQFIDLSPEEILYGESDYYPAYQQATGLKREMMRAVINYDLHPEEWVTHIEGLVRTPLFGQDEQTPESVTEPHQMGYDYEF